MRAPIVVKLDDGTALVDLRRYLDERAAQRWPHRRTGKRGRPGGGGMRALAAAMGIHPSRLSHLITEAEETGSIRTSLFHRFARAFEEPPKTLMERYLEWWTALTTTKEK